jgi:hypothetical protein
MPVLQRSLAKAGYGKVPGDTGGGELAGFAPAKGRACGTHSPLPA